MINQLLTLARAEAGELPLQHSPVGLVPMLRNAVELMAPLAADKGVSLSLESPAEIIVQGDKEWLEHAVLNLLDNALKYTPSGGTVTVVATDGPTEAVVEVQDTGVGIPENALPHVFERFYRADPARDKTIEGVGLGLSLVKWIVDRHAGSIQVASRVNQGSRFILRLPYIKQN